MNWSYQDCTPGGYDRPSAFIAEPEFASTCQSARFTHGPAMFPLGDSKMPSSAEGDDVRFCQDSTTAYKRRPSLEYAKLARAIRVDPRSPRVRTRCHDPSMPERCETQKPL